MINESKTKELFGYTSDDLSPKSSKKVVAVCEQCSTERLLRKHAAIKSKICINCQRINQAKIIAKKDRFGRKHSEKTKKKIGDANFISQKRGKDSPIYGTKRTEWHKAKIAESNRKRIWTDEQRKKLSNAHKGKILPESQRKKMGDSRRGPRNPNYGKPAAHGKGAFYEKDGDKIWMRSGWEIKTAEYLDSHKISWEYEPTAFPIKYSGKQGTYRPDFAILDGKRIVEYWEIKGYWRDDAKEKFDAFVEQHPHLVIKVLEKQELTEKGILG